MKNLHDGSYEIKFELTYSVYSVPVTVLHPIIIAIILSLVLSSYKVEGYLGQFERSWS